MILAAFAKQLLQNYSKQQILSAMKEMEMKKAAAETATMNPR